jgi:DNA-binding HxlR family transcriptional regulator
MTSKADKIMEQMKDCSYDELLSIVGRVNYKISSYDDSRKKDILNKIGKKRINKLRKTFKKLEDPKIIKVKIEREVSLSYDREATEVFPHFQDIIDIDEVDNNPVVKKYYEKLQGKVEDFIEELQLLADELHNNSPDLFDGEIWELQELLSE